MRRLTVPEETSVVRRLHPTGNHFVSLPVIEAADGSVDRVGLLHFGTVSLIEFAGRGTDLGAEARPAIEPFLRPFAVASGRVIRPGWGSGELSWSRLENWIPVFEWRDEPSGLVLRGTILAPVRREGGKVSSHKGFVYVLEVLAGGADRQEVPGDLRLGLSLVWGDFVQTVYTSRPLPAELAVRPDRWTGGPVLEPRSGAGAGQGAMAVAFSAPLEDVEWSRVPDGGGAVGDGPGGAGAVGGGPSAAGTSGVVRLEMKARPAPVAGPARPAGPRGSLAAAFYFGCNREGDGARTAAVDLARHGWEKLLEETRACLRDLHRPADDPAGGLVLEERLNLNLLFNYFFAVGRTIDTEDLVLVTSRSPLYYVSAAFWARDALLWSFPALLLADPSLAEEVLGVAFERYFRHPGIHSLYMDGSVLYPGFELDELAAYPIALWRYVKATGDRGILARRALGPKLRRLLDILAAVKHPDPGVHLFSTFLLPSDDPATYPYVTYDNVLAWRALLATADLLEWDGAPAAEAAGLRAEADRVKASVLRHCVVEGPDGPMFAWSVDSAGGSDLGDEPPGSLELLPYYGFCRRDDRVWQRTIEWVRSPRNPYRYAGVPFPGLGCPHAEHPFVMSLFNALLGGLPPAADEAAAVLRRASLDTGLACESFDRGTGTVKTGAAFATCAGFLAYAMDLAFGAGHPRAYRNGPWFVE